MCDGSLSNFAELVDEGRHLANAQAVETLIAWAEELGHDEVVRFLTTT